MKDDFDVFKFFLIKRINLLSQTKLHQLGVDGIFKACFYVQPNLSFNITFDISIYIFGT